MAAKTKYKVVATMIVVRVPGAQGGEVYFNRGRTLPDTVESSELKRLLALGLIEKFIPPVEDAKLEDTSGAGKDSSEKDSAPPAGDCRGKEGRWPSHRRTSVSATCSSLAG